MASKNGKKHIPDGPQPTPAMEIRRLREEERRGYDVMLSSGLVFRLRPISLERMLKAGEIPDLLAPVAGKSIWAEMSGEEIGRELELVRNMFDLMDLICTAAIVEPRVVDDPQEDDEISIDMIDTTDKYEIYQLVTQPGWVLRKFRDQQIAGVEALPDGDSVQAAAVLSTA